MQIDRTITHSGDDIHLPKTGRTANENREIRNSSLASITTQMNARTIAIEFT
jgi:hypothetical protein